MHACVEMLQQSSDDTSFSALTVSCLERNVQDRYKRLRPC